MLFEIYQKVDVAMQEFARAGRRGRQAAIQ
jgi:hypothetical protein